jgi:2-keto-3-deoxy-L-rhamnonate aldolase RhmA
MPAFMAQANKDLCVSIMIKTVGALAAAGDIAALPGIDYTSFGLDDLGQSLGFPGDTKHRDVVAAVEDASRRWQAGARGLKIPFANEAAQPVLAIMDPSTMASLDKRPRGTRQEANQLRSA